jgi:hypothetical protein
MSCGVFAIVEVAEGFAGVAAVPDVDAVFGAGVADLFLEGVSTVCLGGGIPRRRCGRLGSFSSAVSGAEEVGGGVLLAADGVLGAEVVEPPDGALCGPEGADVVPAGLLSAGLLSAGLLSAGLLSAGFCSGLVSVDLPSAGVLPGRRKVGG